MTEVRLEFKSLSAKRGADCYRVIRHEINNCRGRGVEPKKVWVGKDTEADMQEMWIEACRYFDRTLPREVAGVPFEVGFGLGVSRFMFEYYADAEDAHTLRRRAADNPLPDNA